MLLNKVRKLTMVNGQKQRPIIQYSTPGWAHRVITGSDRGIEGPRWSPGDFRYKFLMWFLVGPAFVDLLHWPYGIKAE